MALAAFLSASTASGPAIASSFWSVVVDGEDRTAAADPLEAAGEVLVDLAALGSVLGLEVTLAPSAVAVVDRRGGRWTGRPGGSLLRAGDETLRLAWVRQTRTSWHVPVPAVAALAGFDLRLDRAAAVVELTSPSREAVGATAVPLASLKADVSAPDAGGSWQSFTVPKTAEEIAESDRLAAAQERPRPRELPVLPSARQSLRATVGVGFRQGGEWGAEIAVAGEWSDWTVDLTGAAAAGPGGSDAQGHLSIQDPRRAWSIEAGSLYSEAWGYAEGLRVARARERHRPAFSLYLPGAVTRYRQPLVAYRDDIRLGGGVSLGGEATSEGRWSLTGRLRRRRFSGSVYGQGGGDATASSGASVRLDLGPVGLSGTYQLSDSATGRRIDSHNLQLSLPRLGRLTSTLEAWGSRSDSVRSHAEGATVNLPVGSLRLRLRYLVRTNVVELPGHDALSQQHHELVTYASYARASRLRLDLQLASRWQRGGEMSHRADLQASFALAAATRLQLLGSLSFPGEAAERYLVRLTQDLPRGLRLIAEVGDVVGFPVSRSLLAPGQQPGSVKLLLERTWDVDTPAGGGAVGGRVVDPGGLPAAGVPVRLGPYRVFTDDEGRYLFRKVPPGGYELSLEEAGLPAHLQALSVPLDVRVARGQRRDHALIVAPLGRISGRVFVDRDDDRRIGAGETVGGVVLLLGEQATTSDRDGSFTFHNLPAGRYTVQVAASLLSEDLQTAAPSRYDIGLPAGGSLDGLAVRLLPRRRPIVFQEM